MELLEASFYGLLERIPTLLTSVSVDTANAVSIRPITKSANLYGQKSNHVAMVSRCTILSHIKYTRVESTTECICATECEIGM